MKLSDLRHVIMLNNDLSNFRSVMNSLDQEREIKISDGDQEILKMPLAEIRPVVEGLLQQLISEREKKLRGLGVEPDDAAKVTLSLSDGFDF